MTKAVDRFADLHKRPSEMFEAIRILRKIQARSRKILNLQEVSQAAQQKGMDKVGSVASNQSAINAALGEGNGGQDAEDPNVAMTQVRMHMVQFLEDAQADR